MLLRLIWYTCIQIYVVHIVCLYSGIWYTLRKYVLASLNLSQRYIEGTRYYEVRRSVITHD
jgi:hypothetical protein